MTANDLLKNYLEYSCYWSTIWGTNNQSAEIRQKRLISLMKVFDILPLSKNGAQISDCFSFFEQGLFLNDVKSEHKYQELEEQIIKFADEIISKRFSANEQWKRNISYQTIFKELLFFRKKMDNLYLPTGIRLEGRGGISEHFVQYQKGKILKPLKKQMMAIDKILCLIIDPRKRDFNTSVLIEKYNYPEANLDKIDIDWISEGI